MRRIRREGEQIVSSDGLGRLATIIRKGKQVRIGMGVGYIWNELASFLDALG